MENQGGRVLATQKRQNIVPSLEKREKKETELWDSQFNSNT